MQLRLVLEGATARREVLMEEEALVIVESARRREESEEVIYSLCARFKPMPYSICVSSFCSERGCRIGTGEFIEIETDGELIRLQPIPKEVPRESFERIVREIPIGEIRRIVSDKSPMERIECRKSGSELLCIEQLDKGNRSSDELVQAIALLYRLLETEGKPVRVL